MAQFIELDTSYGVPTRVNVACIMRYFRGARQQTTTVVLMGGTEYEIRQDVAEIDTRIRNDDKKAIFSQA